MRTMSRLLLTVGVAVLMAAPLLAQNQPGGRRGQGGRGGGGFGGGGVTFLISNKSVQEELKLSEDDAKKANDAADEVAKKHADDSKGLDRMKEEDRAKLAEIRQTISKEELSAVLAILKPDQAKRLQEIRLQQSLRNTGPAALLGADLQTSLKLDDGQKEKIKAIADDFTKERQQVMQEAGFGGRRGAGGGGGGGGGGGRPDPAKREEAMKKVEGLNKESMTKVLALLSDDQKKTLDGLKGPAFELKIERPRD
jgi:hypothetical protein